MASIQKYEENIVVLQNVNQQKFLIDLLDTLDSSKSTLWVMILILLNKFLSLFHHIFTAAIKWNTLV